MMLKLRLSILLLLLCFVLSGCPQSTFSDPSGTLPAAASATAAEEIVSPTTEPTVPPTAEPTVPSTTAPTVPPTTEQTVPPTTEPATPPVTEDEKTDMVWIPKTGKKYHAKESCSGMKDPAKISKEEAENRGYAPCKRCYS